MASSQAELQKARDRVRKIAKGGFINTVYRKFPGEALEAFRQDLLRILDDV